MCYVGPSHRCPCLFLNIFLPHLPNPNAPSPPPPLTPQELAYRYRSPTSTPKRASHGGSSAWQDSNNAPPASPCAAAAAAMAGGSLARQGSIERSLDIGVMTASVVLSMYQHDNNELVLLSELQVGACVFYAVAQAVGTGACERVCGVYVCICCEQ